jgi:hypothetical protein
MARTHPAHPGHGCLGTRGLPGPSTPDYTLGQGLVIPNQAGAVRNRSAARHPAGEAAPAKHPVGDRVRGSWWSVIRTPTRTRAGEPMQARATSNRNTSLSQLMVARCLQVFGSPWTRQTVTRISW